MIQCSEVDKTKERMSVQWRTNQVADFFEKPRLSYLHWWIVFLLGETVYFMLRYLLGTGGDGIYVAAFAGYSEPVYFLFGTFMTAFVFTLPLLIPKRYYLDVLSWVALTGFMFVSGLFSCDDLSCLAVLVIVPLFAVLYSLLPIVIRRRVKFTSVRRLVAVVIIEILAMAALVAVTSFGASVSATVGEIKVERSGVPAAEVTFEQRLACDRIRILNKYLARWDYDESLHCPSAGVLPPGQTSSSQKTPTICPSELDQLVADCNIEIFYLGSDVLGLCTDDGRAYLMDRNLATGDNHDGLPASFGSCAPKYFIDNLKPAKAMDELLQKECVKRWAQPASQECS